MFRRYGHHTESDPENHHNLPIFAKLFFKHSGHSNPHGHHSHGPPLFGRHPHRHPLFGPHTPMTRESFKEIKQFIVLTILSNKSEGITAYQLEKQYSFPRGNLLRALDELEEKKYVETKETVEKGRAQKLYTITDEGKGYLEELKEKWANHFAIMSEIAPPEHYGHPFLWAGPHRCVLDVIEEFESKEDALDQFRGMRSHLKSFITRLEKRKEHLETKKSEIDEIIEKIEKMEDLDLDEIKEMVKKIHKRDTEPD